MTAPNPSQFLERVKAIVDTYPEGATIAVISLAAKSRASAVSSLMSSHPEIFCHVGKLWRPVRKGETVIAKGDFAKANKQRLTKIDELLHEADDTAYHLDPRGITSKEIFALRKLLSSARELVLHVSPVPPESQSFQRQEAATETEE